MRRAAVIFLVLGAVTAGISMAALNIWDEETRSVQANASTVVGYDMDPNGNSCPNDGTNCTLGSIEKCIAVESVQSGPAIPGPVFQIDTFIDNIALGDSVLGYGYGIDHWPGTLIGQTHTDPLINLNAQPGSSPIAIEESVPDPPGEDPPPHITGVNDMAYAEYNPPFTHGTLGRYTLDVTGVAPGIYALTLTAGGPEGVQVIRDMPPGGVIFDPGGVFANGVDDDGDGDTDEDQVWDGNFSPYYGMVAVDMPCGPAPITPVPTPTATPTPTVTPTPTPPTQQQLLTGWNHVCYIGLGQPIANALTGISSEVLAVYRLAPGSGFDRWFPDRPDISTITAVNSYEALFILMAKDATWAQQTAGTPPASVNLSQGWNSTCYCGQTKGVEAATAGVAEDFAVLYALAPDHGWTHFVPTRPEISNLTELQRFTAVVSLITAPGGAHWAFDP